VIFVTSFLIIVRGARYLNQEDTMRYIVIGEETYLVETQEQIEEAQEALRLDGLDKAAVWEGDPEEPGDDVKTGSWIFAEDAGKPGRPSTLTGTIGELAREVGGVQALADQLGGVAPSTLGRWDRREIQISGPARQLLDRLCREHGLLTLDERDELAERLALDEADRALLVSEGQFRGLDLPGATDRTLGHSLWVAYLPSVQQGAWVTNGDPVWIDATSLDDAVRQARA
jgi:hypothetical protein